MKSQIAFMATKVVSHPMVANLRWDGVALISCSWGYKLQRPWDLIVGVFLGVINCSVHDIKGEIPRPPPLSPCNIGMTSEHS